MSSRQKIAVIGSGIAGLGSAWLLHKRHDVTLFEKNAALGGHSHTVEVDYDGTTIAVDTGFIVYNHKTYPHLKALFEHLAVPTKKSNMSFGISVGELEYSSNNPFTMFANPKQLFMPRYWRMLLDIVTFNRKAPELLYRDTTMTLGQYLDEIGMQSWFRDYYLLPMATAIWSCPVETMLDYPAKSFIKFFHDHGLLTVTKQPQWYTVDGGSREYVKRMAAALDHSIYKNAAVQSVMRGDGKVSIMLETGELHFFDQVVIAAHGDQALRLLSNPTPEEQSVLSSFTYEKNRAVLHRDPALMPTRRAAWSSWVYLRDEALPPSKTVAVSYWMNQLQGIDAKKPLFVTLNPLKEPAADKIFGEFEYEHPIFDEAAVAAQARLPSLQGADRIWYAGSYHRYGFHEDALMSAVDVANRLGVKAPWQ